MLGIWIASVLAAGTLLVLAARLVEHTVRSRRRWLWGTVMVGVPLLPLLAVALGSFIPAAGTVEVILGSAAPIWSAALRGLGAAAGASHRGVTEAALMGVWAMVTLALLALLAVGVLRLRRRRRGWKRDVVDGLPVLLSDGFGPAVVGVRHPDIVLPPWVLELRVDERALILAHEDEHRRRGDPGLLAAAFALAAAFPWNLPGWWALFRLRDAVETDCDARVLTGRVGSRERYARLLFDVGSRTVGAVPLGAGFGERVSSLERRIREMLKVRARRKRLVVEAAVAGVLVVAACTVDVMGVGTRGQQEQDRVQTAQQKVQAAPGSTAVEPQSGPHFTPYTLRPRILNRDAVQEALQHDYPPLLRDAGIGGTVHVYFHIDVQGNVDDVRIETSSGHQALDQAALNVARTMRFKAAQNHDQKVAVWVSFPITFAVH